MGHIPETALMMDPLIEKVPTTEVWTWIVFISCICVFITTPIFTYIIICIIRKNPKSNKLIMATACGYLIFLFMFSISQFVIFNPSRWNIKPSKNICTYVKRPEIVTMSLARFCFYQFCLFRIKIIFSSIPKLRLPRYQFIIMEVLIFGYALYHGIVFNVLTTMKPHPMYGFCMAIQHHSNLHVGIFIIWDAIIVFILIWMFAGKLIYGTASHDITFQKYIIKTSVLGILSTFSALMVTFLFFLGRMNRFVFVTDGLINSFCIVFSFNMRYVTIPCLKHDKKLDKIETYIEKSHQTQTQINGKTNVEVEMCDTVQSDTATVDNYANH